MRRCFLVALCCLGYFVFHPFSLAATEWQQPTPEELSMTAEPASPGDSAVFLNVEVKDDDDHFSQEVYVREKILTEAAKRDSDVIIAYSRRYFTIGGVAGRTIHSDGTIVPFTGKAMDRILVKGQGIQYRAKVFSMPDVQVGSILEYRYEVRYEDNYVVRPWWILQRRHFIRKAHYVYYPFTVRQGGSLEEFYGKDAFQSSYVSILPPGAAVKYVDVQGAKPEGGLRSHFEINLTNLKAIAREDYQPPIDGLSYRVLFYRQRYDNADKFWKGVGKDWSKEIDHFIGSSSQIKKATNDLISPTDTPDQKLHKIYNAVMALENTEYSREYSRAEEKANGQDPIKSSEDVWSRKRGNGEQIALLFAAMVRAAGLPAYVMAVSNRDKYLFEREFPSIDQFNDDIVIVPVDGVDRYFDPGSRYCTFAQLDWKHAGVGGLRQTAAGADVATTPNMSYKESLEEWIGRLTIDKSGSVTGIVQMRETGAPALIWRQALLRGDLTDETKDLEDVLKKRMPAGMSVKLKTLISTTEFDKPLIAQFEVSGPVATATQKRILFPAHLFQAGTQPTFTSATRENAIYFDYPFEEVDDVQITIPAGFSVESMPKPGKESMQKAGLYIVNSLSKEKTIAIGRQFALAEYLFPLKGYAELRTFYGKVDSGDREQIVLKMDTTQGGN